MNELFTVESEPVNNIRRQTLNGREYVVADVIMLKEGVLNGSKGKLYYPPEEVAANPGIWNGFPLTVPVHPFKDGKPISARQPEAWHKFVVGQIFNDKIVGNQRHAEAWVDVELANRIDARLVPSILVSKKINVSTGLFTSDSPAPEGATFNGISYTHIARNYRPDHLAILMDDLGACSVKDGCGININAGFQMPENYEKIKDLPNGQQLFAGANDWESGWTWAGIHEDVVKNNPTPEPVKWLNISHKACPGCKGELDAYGKNAKMCQEFAKEAVDTWIDKNLTTNSFPEDSMNERGKLVAFLTTNCDCWKGKEATLNDEKAFSEDDLKKFKANVEASTLAINTLKTVGETVNIPKDAKLSDIADLVKTAVTNKDKKVEEPAMNKEQVQTAMKDYLTNLSEDERIKLIASPTLNSLMETGKQMIEDKRIEIMKSLTANVTNADEKKAKLLKLKDKTLPQLQEIAEFAATVNVTKVEDDKSKEDQFLNNFFGAAGANERTDNSRPKSRKPLVINSYIPGAQDIERVA